MFALRSFSLLLKNAMVALAEPAERAAAPTKPAEPSDPASAPIELTEPTEPASAEASAETPAAAPVRRSRWSAETTPAAPAEGSEATAHTLSSGRRSRWGTKVADPPAKRSRWGAKEPVAPPNPLQLKLDEVNRLLEGDTLPEDEKEILVNTRTQLVMKMVAEQQRQLQVDMGLLPPAQPVQMQCKVMLPADSCPGGVQSLVGLVIGARGSTQQLLQEKSGCRVVVRSRAPTRDTPQPRASTPVSFAVLASASALARSRSLTLSRSRAIIEQVRGKGSNKTKTIFGEDDDEETHVLITGPGEEAVQIARKLVETLIDFNSAEGENMRQEQRKKGQILNGTYREDKDVELRHLLFSGDKAKETGALGKSAPAPWLAAATAPWLAGAAPPEAAAASAADNEDEYARLMSEINGDDAPAANAAPAAPAAPAPPPGPPGAPPPPWAAGMPSGLQPAAGPPGAPPPHHAPPPPWAHHTPPHLHPPPGHHPHAPPGWPPPPPWGHHHPPGGMPPPPWGHHHPPPHPYWGHPPPHGVPPPWGHHHHPHPNAWGHHHQPRPGWPPTAPGGAPPWPGAPPGAGAGATPPWPVAPPEARPPPPPPAAEEEPPPPPPPPP
jgi:hypothetical protein